CDCDVRSRIAGARSPQRRKPRCASRRIPTRGCSWGRHARWCSASRTRWRRTSKCLRSKSAPTPPWRRATCIDGAAGLRKRPRGSRAPTRRGGARERAGPTPRPRFARAYAAGGGAEALRLNAQALFLAGDVRAADEALHLWATQVPDGLARLSEARAELFAEKRDA